MFSTELILFARRRQAQDAVVLLAYRGAVGVVIGGRDPQGPVGGLNDIPHAADLAVEELLPVHDLIPLVQLQAPEPLSAQGGHKEVSFPLRDSPIDRDLRPARGGFRGRPDGDGVYVPLILTAPALDRGPAVVLSGFDPVDFIPRVLAELARVEPSPGVPGEAFDVAMAVGVDGATGKGIVGRNGTVGLYPQDLTPERVPVLGVPGFSGVAGGHVEHAVGAELDPTPVVVRIDRDAR